MLVDILQGDEYGNPTNTVVVDTRHMSSAWFSSGSTKRVSRSNVGHYQRGIPSDHAGKTQIILLCLSIYIDPSTMLDLAMLIF